jgi:hypothetical protein
MVLRISSYLVGDDVRMERRKVKEPMKRWARTRESGVEDDDRSRRFPRSAGTVSQLIYASYLGTAQ